MIHHQGMDTSAIAAMALSTDLPLPLFLLELSQLFLKVVDASVNGQMLRCKSPVEEMRSFALTLSAAAASSFALVLMP